MMDYQVQADVAAGGPPRAGSSNMRVSFNPSAFGHTGKPEETR